MKCQICGAIFPVLPCGTIIDCLGCGLKTEIVDAPVVVVPVKAREVGERIALLVGYAPGEGVTDEIIAVLEEAYPNG